MKCPDCKTNDLKFFNGRYTLRCRLCTKLHNQKLNKIYFSKKVYKKKEFLPITCKKCLKVFLPYTANQVFCRTPCVTMRYNTENTAERWLIKNEKKEKKCKIKKYGP